MKRKGYAFVEFAVLISITVVVASALIVYLVNNSNNVKFKPMYLKVISTLNSASLMAKAQGDASYATTLDLCPAEVEDVKNQKFDNSNSFCTIFNEVLLDAEYIGMVKDIKYTKKNAVLPYRLKKRDILPEDYMNYNAYQLKDGTIIAFHRFARSCELPNGIPLYNEGTGFYSGPGIDLRYCIGFIDVNGPQPPNREVTCKKGKNVMGELSDCVVNMRANAIADVYPVVFYNDTVEPLTSASKFVLMNSKK